MRIDVLGSVGLNMAPDTGNHYRLFDGLFGVDPTLASSLFATVQALPPSQRARGGNLPPCSAWRVTARRRKGICCAKAG